MANPEYTDPGAFEDRPTRPAEPTGTDDCWYRDWECGYDDMSAKYGAEPYRAYKGGCDLDAPQLSARTWDELLDAIDDEEEE